MLTRGNPVALARLACRHAFAGDRFDAMVAALEGCEPDALLGYVRRHRIAGLVWQAIGDTGAMTAAPFAALAREAGVIRDSNLRAIDLIAEFEGLLTRSEIDRLHLKGQALGALCWPQPLAKSSWDIDLLIDVARLDDVVPILEALGFTPTLPASSSELGRWHRHRKESVWTRGSDGMVVELHGRALPWPDRGPSLASARQSVTLASGLDVETFADAPLRTYLALHGASSLWFRMKWIADYAALVHRRRPPAEPGRATRVADALAAQMFGEPPAPALSALDRLMLTLATRELTGPAAWREPTDAFLGTVPIHLSQMLVAGPGDLVRQAREALRG